MNGWQHNPEALRASEAYAHRLQALDIRAAHLATAGIDPTPTIWAMALIERARSAELRDPTPTMEEA